MRFLAILLVLWLLPGHSAGAATIGISNWASGDGGANQDDIEQVVVKISGGFVTIYDRDTSSPGLCVKAANGACRKELSMIFFGPIQELSFAGTREVSDRPLGTPLANRYAAFAGHVIDRSVAASGEPKTGVRQFAATNLQGRTRPIFGSGGGLVLPPTPPDEDDQGGAGPIVAPPLRVEVLDFTTYQLLDPNGRTAKIPGATLTLLDGDTIFFYDAGEFGMPVTGGFCALDSGFRCLGDIRIVFDTLIQNLSFSTYFYKPGDQALVRLFAGTELLTERSIAQAGRIDFFGLVGISHIEIFDRSRFGNAGLAYGNFRYSVYEPPVSPPVLVSPVPLPAGGLVFSFVLACAFGAGMCRGRTRKSPAL